MLKAAKRENVEVCEVAKDGEEVERGSVDIREGRSSIGEGDGDGWLRNPGCQGPAVFCHSSKKTPGYTFLDCSELGRATRQSLNEVRLPGRCNSPFTLGGNPP